MNVFKIIVVLGGFVALVGCTTTATSPMCFPISVCTNQIISEAAALHQLKMALDAVDQTPVVVMQPQPVIITPNPVVPSPVVVTPVIPTPAPVPPVVGTGVPQFPTSPVITPSLRQKSHVSLESPRTRKFDFSTSTFVFDENLIPIELRSMASQ